MPDMDGRLATLVQKLREQGHNVTPQRMAILQILTSSPDHPTVEQVFEQVRVNFPMTSLATVYKTITMLKEMGEILELGFAGESSRYDGVKPYPHPHLICVHCATIIDPDLGRLDQFPKELADKYGFQIVSQRIDFYGVCPRCQGEVA